MKQAAMVYSFCWNWLVLLSETFLKTVRHGLDNITELHLLRRQTLQYWAKITSFASLCSSWLNLITTHTESHGFAIVWRSPKYASKYIYAPKRNSDVTGEKLTDFGIFHHSDPLIDCRFQKKSSSRFLPENSGGKTNKNNRFKATINEF